VIQLISQLRGYFYINSWLSLSLAITIFSFAGVPPLIGFFAKQMVLSAALDNGYIFLSLIAILSSVVGGVYYLGIVRDIFFYSPEHKLNSELVNSNITITSPLSLTISIFSLLIVVFMFISTELLGMITILTQNMISPIYEVNTCSFLVSSQGEYIAFAPICLNICKNMNYNLRYLDTIKLYCKTLVSRAHLYSTHYKVTNKDQSGNELPTLDPWFITGLVDAEGCFTILFRKRDTHKVGWNVEALFTLGLHKKDHELLKLLQLSLGGVGKIFKNRDNYELRVNSIKQIFETILPHFYKYALITQKQSDYLRAPLPPALASGVWKQGVMMMVNKEHLTPKGLQALVNLKASINKGLSSSLKTSFPETVPASKSEVERQALNNNWLAGFATGDGCFRVYVGKSKTHKVGFVVSLEFILTQHPPFGGRLMQDIISFLGCGKYYPHSVREAGSIWCRSFKDIEAKIIPLFMKHPIKGTKAQDFLNWCEIAEIIKAGDHHNKEGIAKIKEIQANMNRSRDFGVILEANAFGPLLEAISVIGSVYVRLLIIKTPGPLSPLFETKIIRDKPVNLSDFEMNRGVQHVEKGFFFKNNNLDGNVYCPQSKKALLLLSHIILQIALVPLSHAIFYLSVRFEPTNFFLVHLGLKKNLPSISINSMLIGYIVSFGRPKTTSLRKLAKRKISDVLIRIKDLLREVIPKISFKLISSANVGGRRSFRSIKFRFWEGKQNSILRFSSLASAGYKFSLIKYLAEVSKNKTRSVLNRTEKCVVKHTFNLDTIRYISSAPAIQSAKPLDPWFITGFVEAEGCFMINFYRDKKLNLGMSVRAAFSITLHIRDIDLLHKIKAYFGDVGLVTQWKDSAIFKVQSIKEISENIIPHFDKYSLITQKQADYLLFKEIVILMLRKEHLSKKGLQLIINIKASLNLGLSEDLKETFPETKPVARLVIKDQKIPNPEWVAGFTSGDGSFYISAFNSPTRKLGVQVRIWFVLSQHSRDESLIKSLEKYFDCGYYRSQANKGAGEFTVGKLSDITEKIIPFFNKYIIRGIKFKDFKDWCQIVELMNDDKGLSQKKLDQILKIKSSMNTGRK